MRPIIVVALVGLGGCIAAEPCDAPAEEVFDTVIMDRTHGQAYLTTPAAAKDCHAVFTARLAYTGDDALDPTLPPPMVDVSANAVGTGGEQPGLLGILTSWQLVEDDTTGARSWWAEMDAAARNIDAPAVTYGMTGVLQPDSLVPVEYMAQITYRPPATEPVAATTAARGSCR